MERQPHGGLRRIGKGDAVFLFGRDEQMIARCQSGFDVVHQHPRRTAQDHDPFIMGLLVGAVGWSDLTLRNDALDTAADRKSDC